jgi:hypothetical protein
MMVPFMLVHNRVKVGLSGTLGVVAVANSLRCHCSPLGTTSVVSFDDVVSLLLQTRCLSQFQAATKNPNIAKFFKNLSI